jgi:DNA-binding CsgD family transcriptional regulator/DNA-binding Lrp family transcriptional regulator
MKPVILKLSSPVLAAAVCDVPLMQRWEVLRRSDNPMTPRELAAVCGVSPEQIQDTLDRLVDAGLAVRNRASSKSRAVTYRAIGKDVVIEWSDESEVECQRVDEHHACFRRAGHALVERLQAAPASKRKGRNWLVGDLTATLNHEESRQAVEIISNALDALRALEQTAYKRIQSGDVDTTKPPGPAPQPRHYYANLQMQELDAPQLPLPTWTFWSSRSIAHMIARIESSPSALLSPREHDIARRLAAGDSRPEIAKAMRISQNTVASTAKRIYAKLGVHSRAELASRMRTG